MSCLSDDVAKYQTIVRNIREFVCRSARWTPRSLRRALSNSCNGSSCNPSPRRNRPRLSAICSPSFAFPQNVFSRIGLSRTASATTAFAQYYISNGNRTKIQKSRRVCRISDTPLLFVHVPRCLRRRLNLRNPRGFAACRRCCATRRPRTPVPAAGCLW